MWGDIQDIFLFGCPKTIDITGFFKKFCIATRTRGIKKNTYSVSNVLAEIIVSFHFLNGTFPYHKLFRFPVNKLLSDLFITLYIIAEFSFPEINI